MKFFQLLLTIHVFLFSFALQAEEISGKLIVKAEEGNYQTAKPYLFEFILHPVGDRTLDELDSLVKIGNFIKYFYIFDIKEKRFSINNQDAYVVRGQLVPTEAYRPNEMIPLKMGERNIYVSVEAPPINKLEDSYKGLIIPGFPQWKYMYWWQKIVAALLLIFALYGLYHLFQLIRYKHKIKKERKLAKITWVENFRNAQTRGEFERLYRNKHIWIDVLGCRNPETINFLKDINDVQFKAEWSKDDFQQVKSSTASVLKTLEEAQ